ncbi:translation initiation factor IF-2-like [Eublepharis macularius]|uniref:Translation initiation factor IF-2-like n=1 Tax=Eublepharis macularius TaxID=481883 RepID=A0AA97LGY3_EUBMA|nr:translation initiation factor IF-2-like [Eublepharis macularius]
MRRPPPPRPPLRPGCPGAPGPSPPAPGVPRALLPRLRPRQAPFAKRELPGSPVPARRLALCTCSATLTPGWSDAPGGWIRPRRSGPGRRLRAGGRPREAEAEASPAKPRRPLRPAGLAPSAPPGSGPAPGRRRPHLPCAPCQAHDRAADAAASRSRGRAEPSGRPLPGWWLRTGAEERKRESGERAAPSASLPGAAPPAEREEGRPAVRQPRAPASGARQRPRAVRSPGRPSPAHPGRGRFCGAPAQPRAPELPPPCPQWGGGPFCGRPQREPAFGSPLQPAQPRPRNTILGCVAAFSPNPPSCNGRPLLHCILGSPWDRLRPDGAWTKVTQRGLEPSTPTNR